MPNRCVATGCGNMPSDSVSLFRFPKDPNKFFWTRQIQPHAGALEVTTYSGSLPGPFQCRLLRRNSSAESNLICFAVQCNRVLKSTAVPEKKPRKSKAAEK